MDIDTKAYETRMNLERLLDRLDGVQPPTPTLRRTTGPACQLTSLDFLETEAGPIHWKTKPHQVETLVAVCNVCGVQSECLERALSEGNEFGVWGGLVPKERKRMLTSVRRR